jgi:hypothetical protein
MHHVVAIEGEMRTKGVEIEKEHVLFAFCRKTKTNDD